MRKQIGLLFLIKIFRIPLNLVLLTLTARYFGVSLEKDIWLYTFTTMIVIDSALWGPINETFRTKFVFLKEQNSSLDAIALTQSLLTYFIIFSLLLIGLITTFPDVFAHLIAPNYNSAKLAIVSDMLLYVAPVLIFNQLMQIGIGILNAYEIFFIAEISGFVSTIINIGILYFLAEKIGILALPFSYYISTGLLIIFIIIFILKNKIPLFTKNWNFRFNGFKMFFIFALPFFLPYFFGQVNSMVEKILASGISNGTISILDFSNRIPLLMYGIVINIITTILVPVLSKYYIRGDKSKFNEEFSKVFQLGLLVIGFIVAFVAGSSIPIVHFLYDKGTIAQSDLVKISEMSILYSFSLIGIFLYVIFGMSLLSSEKQKYYAFMGMLTQITVTLLNFILVKYLGIYTFPLSILSCHFIFGIFMFLKYPYRKGLKLDIKYFIIITLLLLIAYLGISKIQTSNFHLTIIIQIIMLCVIFLVLSVVFRLEEKKLVIIFIKNKFSKLKQ